MANIFGAKLSRAIRDRAYAAGLIERRTAQVGDLRAALDQATQELEAAQAVLARCDEDLATLSAIDPADIRAIRRSPKSGLFAYGALSRTIVTLFKETDGPISTPTIIAVVSQTLGLPMATPMERKATRHRIRKQLQAFARRGSIERLHDPSKPDPGIWRWHGH